MFDGSPGFGLFEVRLCNDLKLQKMTDLRISMGYQKNNNSILEVNLIHQYVKNLFVEYVQAVQAYK